jgi:heat shock protein HslJ
VRIVIRERTFVLLSAASLLATSLLLATAGAGLAQEEPTTPEGVEWTLVSYATPGTTEPQAVPLTVEATLLLEAGVASGSGGCNSFSGSYQLEGTSLTFSPEMTRTLVLCEPDVQAVEEAYLAALPGVTGWSVLDETLVLSDELGAPLLTFEIANVALTPSQLGALLLGLEELGLELDGLVLTADGLQTQVDSMNIVRLRERLRALEADNEELKEQLESSSGNGQGQAPSGQFSRGERILLEGVPARIASRCTPLRSSLPKGTRAAVSCTPNTSAVSNVDYYLMNGPDAAAAFTSTMNTFNVPEAASTTQTCASGVKSQRTWVGAGWQSEGCFRTTGRAEVRFVDNATDCRQLTVGGKRLASPAIYMALQADGPDIAAVHDWATGGTTGGSSQRTSITRPIERPNAPISPSCPT